MTSFVDIVALAGNWPGVEVSRWYGTRGLKVAGKGFCRLWSQREHDRDAVHDSAVLVVLCDADEKPALLDAAGGVLFSTAHYEGSGAMLVRLDDVMTEDLAGYLEDAYRCKATARLLAEFDSTASDTSPAISRVAESAEQPPG